MLLGFFCLFEFFCLFPTPPHFHALQAFCQHHKQVYIFCPENWPRGSLACVGRDMIPVKIKSRQLHMVLWEWQSLDLMILEVFSNLYDSIWSPGATERKLHIVFPLLCSHMWRAPSSLGASSVELSFCIWIWVWVIGCTVSFTTIKFLILYVSVVWKQMNLTFYFHPHLPSLCCPRVLLSVCGKTHA